MTAANTAPTDSDHSSSSRLVPALRRMLPVLALLSSVAPLATDMYLAALPQMAHFFAVDASRVQLTLTAFLLGLALGQLFIGPLSDGWGRRRPLVVGTLLCLVSSLVCILAPSIELLIAARFIQGVSGAAGVVLARAIIADSAQGALAAKMMGMMMLIGGIAPIVAPVAGSFLLELGGWQVIFVALTVLVALMVAGVLALVPETLPREARHPGGLRALAGSVGEVLCNRQYVGYLLIAIGAFGALFAYISASPFVMQNVLGLSAQAYGMAFGVNALGLLGGSLLAVRLAGRVPLRHQVAAGIAVLWTTAALQLVNLSLAPSPLLTLGLLWVSVASFGLVFGNTAVLALSQVPHWRGTASAFYGFFQFGVGALVSPLVGVGGAHDARPMGVAMLVAASVAAFAFVCVTRPPVERDA